MHSGRRASIIGLRGSQSDEISVPFLPLSEDEMLNKIRDLEEELEESKLIIDERNRAFQDIKDELAVLKSESASIIDGLVKEINNKSKEVDNIRNSKATGRASLSRTQSSFLNNENSRSSDLIDEYKQNLQHTRQQMKDFKQKHYILQQEFAAVSQNVEEMYSRRYPKICPLTDDLFKTTKIQEKEEIKVIEAPKEEEITIVPPAVTFNDTDIVKLQVTLPKNNGTKIFEFPLNTTLDTAKKSIFQSKLPFLRSNVYIFGLSADEYLEIEFVKILDAHPSFENIYISGKPIELTLYDKTISRMLGDLQLQSRHLVKGSTEEANLLRKQRNSGYARLSRSVPQKMNKTDEIVNSVDSNNNNQEQTSISEPIDNNNANGNQSNQEIEKNQENLNLDKLNTQVVAEKLLPDHFPICILTKDGIPLIIFAPNDCTENSLKKLILNQFDDTIEKIKGEQSLFFYHNDNSKEFKTIPTDSKIFEHESVLEVRKNGKIPIGSFGNLTEISVTNNNVRKKKKKNESPRNNNQSWEARRQSVFTRQISSNSYRDRSVSVDVSADISSPRLTSSLGAPIRTTNYRAPPPIIETPNRGAIPVTFCFEDQKIELNLPRKATIETMKKLVLQKVGLNDNTSSAVRYVLKVTGTSYFIVEGETFLEDLPIVKFCQKKGLTTMLSLVSKEKTKEDKMISKKVGLILSDSSGGAILNWSMKDTDATDFRIKMSRIIGDRQFQYSPAIFSGDGTVISSNDNINLKSFKICIHLGEEGGTGLQDCTTVLPADGEQTVQNIIERSCKKFKYAANFILIPEEYLLKICGYEIYCQQSTKLKNISYIRECILKKKIISFTLVPNIKVPLHKNRLQIEQQNKENALLVNTPFDTTTIDIFGDNDAVSLLELKNPFEFKVLKIENLFSIGKKMGDIFYLEAGVYHGGILIDSRIMMSNNALLNDNGEIKWKQWLRSPSLKLCEIPEESRVCITLYQRKENSSTSPKLPIANINISLFDFKDHFRTGVVTLQMWTDEEANPIGTCMENLRASKGSVPIIHLSFHSFPMNVAYPHLNPVVLYDNHTIIQPTENEILTLRKLIDSDPLYKLEKNEKQLIWKYREWLRLNDKSKSLIKILLCVEWKSIQQIREIYRLLSEWKFIDPQDALQLLDAQFANRKVREYAVRCLDRLSDDELQDYLLQLVQTLKYEENHFSPLAVWLVNRALRNQIQIGHSFFWHLKSELHVPEIAERYALLLEMYLRGCGTQREDLLKQVHVINSLNEVAQAIKLVPSSRRKADLQKRLSQLDLPNVFQLPLDPL